MKVRMPTLFLSGLSISELFLPTTGSGRSGFAISHNGRRLRTGGSATKFSCGGGEVVAHSSVHAFQGLSPAIFPRKKETTRMLDNERHVEANAHQPERPFPEPLREHATAHFREPILDASHEGEDD